MKIRTSSAVLKLNDEGRKYWHISGENIEPIDMAVGQCIEFNPEAFEEDAEIIIMENTETENTGENKK